MAPDKCSHIIFSGNSAKNQVLNIKLYGKPIPYLNSPTFLGIKFDEALCFNHQIDLIRSRCQDRLNIIKILSSKNWKLSKKTLLGIYKALIGSIIDYSFFIFSRASRTNLHKLQRIQNISIKSIFHLPYDTPSEILQNLMSDLKIDNIETRIKNLFIRYINNCFVHKNYLITDLVKDYVSAFVDSSKPPETKTPLSHFSDLLHQWIVHGT